MTVEKALFIGLLAATLSAPPTPAWPEADLSKNCAPCPSGTRNVALLVYDERLPQGLRYAPYSWFDNRGYEQVTYGVEHLSDLPEVLSEVAASCARVKVLGIYTHGRRGSARFGESERLAIGNARSLLEPRSCAMAEQAHVEFAGCNIGRGCEGEAFLSEVGRALLGRGGGSVTGATKATWSFAGFEFGASGGDLQTLAVKPGFTEPAWARAPQSAAACRKLATAAMADLDSIRNRVARCGSGQEKSDLLSAIQDSEKALSDSLLASRDLTAWPSSNAEHRNFASDFQIGYRGYESVLESDLAEARCPAPAGAGQGPRPPPAAEPAH